MLFLSMLIPRLSQKKDKNSLTSKLKGIIQVILHYYPCSLFLAYIRFTYNPSMVVIRK